MKMLGALALALFLAGCQSDPISHRFTAPWADKSRVPAAELPAGYQVKVQDFWSYSVWKDAKANDLEGICKIKKTADGGFEIGTTHDPMGQAMMKKIEKPNELQLAQRLARLTSQGFENGYSPYWNDCESGKGKKECGGQFSVFTFSEFQGESQGLDPQQSAEIYQERTFAVARGEKTWYQSSHAADVIKASECLCGSNARVEEERYFPKWNSSCDQIAKSEAEEAKKRRPAGLQAVLPFAL